MVQLKDDTLGTLCLEKRVDPLNMPNMCITKVWKDKESEDSQRVKSLWCVVMMYYSQWPKQNRFVSEIWVDMNNGNVITPLACS